MKNDLTKISESVRSGKILISDGGWGTFLQQKGLEPGGCPELWNITHEKEVYDIAKSWFDAGSDMCETNSFGGSRTSLKRYELEEQTVEINKAAAAISRKAAGPDRHVLGSIGPSGIILMMGEVTEEELYEVFKEQAVALENGGADAIIVETMTDLVEAKLAVQAAKENTECEMICTMTFDPTVHGDFRTMMGISPSQMVPELLDIGADVIGANCGNGTEIMIGVAKEIRSFDKNVPILVHSNAGIPKYQQGEIVYPETPDEMASYVAQLIDVGANIIGGCCGTTPEHIRKIVEIAKKKTPLH